MSSRFEAGRAGAAVPSGNHDRRAKGELLAADRPPAPTVQAVPQRRPRSLIPSLYTVAGIAILGAIFLVAMAPKLDTDLWWHLKVGHDIAHGQGVPRSDYLSFTFAGHAWTDHEWLTELFLYGLYAVGGLWATILAFAVIIWTTYALVYRQMLERGVHVILALFVLAVAFVASSPTWGARPQMITLLFLAVYGLVLHRFQHTRDRRWLFFLPVSMLLWANLHGGWVLGLVLVAVTLAGECLNNVTHHDDALSGADLRALGLALAASLLATVVNPNGVHQVLYPLVWILPSVYANVLTEWVSPDFHMLQMMAFEGLLLLLIVAAFVSRARLNWTHLLLVVVFTHLALAEGRNVAVWTVVVAPLVAVYLQATGPNLRMQFPSLGYRRREVQGGLASILNLTLLVLVLLVYLAESVHYINPHALRRDERTTFPAGAVSYLQKHHLGPRVFNSYAWGGYLLWKGYPRYRDFIDGRANTLFNARILGEYMDAYSAAPDWQTVLSRHHVQTVLVDGASPLAQALAENTDWRLRYRDTVAVVYAHS